ncbi:MAG: winged helix-turn-helix domain-containing protein [Candidatus Micrarchaeota archaeon]|nr:winged helix-turn-helix domain-containing protein [Candidatus Micrarchaeota archaeon]
MAEVRIDRELLRAIGADTRIEMLKLLTKGRHTPTMLSEKMGLSTPTVLEHLDKLMEAGLVKRIDEGRKWKYYALTEKGESLVGGRPDVPVRAFIMLAVGVLLLIGPVLMQSYMLKENMQSMDVGDGAAPMVMAKYVSEEPAPAEEEVAAEEANYVPYLQAAGVLLILAAAYIVLTARKEQLAKA